MRLMRTSFSAGDDQSVVGEALAVDLEEDVPHQDDEPKYEHDDDDDLNHGDNVGRDDNDDPDG